jgi:hypothetical protein
MMRSLLPAAALACLLSGCVYTNRYHPAGTQTFLWVPGIAEWKINDNMPCEEFNEAVQRQDDRERQEERDRQTSVPRQDSD